MALERIQGLTLMGWAVDPADPGREQLSLRCGTTVLMARVRRTSREDVCQALGVRVDRPGFEMDLPEEVWSALAQGGALQVLVNQAALPHAQLRPSIQSVSDWLTELEAQPGSIRRTNQIAMAQAHLAVARPLQTALAQAEVVQQAQQGHVAAQVETWRGLTLVGWAADKAQQRASIRLRVGDQTVAAPMRRVSRQDVAMALGRSDELLGFEIEVPGTLWPERAGTEAIDIQVLVDDVACGAPWHLSRAQLANALAAALALNDADQRQHQTLLVMEHLVRADALDTLDDSQREALHAQAEAAGFGLWLRQRGVVAQLPSAAQRRPMPMGPRGRMGKWLNRPERAEWALTMLLGLKGKPGLTRAAENLEVSLTQALGLFDRALYDEQAPPDQRQGASALRHYVRHGDALSLAPNALFDARYYTGQLPGRLHPGVNRLLHYGLVGRFRGLNPCAWFQPQHYLLRNADVADTKIEPWLHYMNWGWREGRTPHPDMAQGHQTCPPLLQRLSHAQQGRHQDPRVDDLLRRLPPSAGVVGMRLPWMPTLTIDGRNYLDLERWRTLKPPVSGRAAVNVIVPVYAGVQETLRCLWSVLAAPVDTPFELLVIDDCSPDPALSAMLRELAAMKLIRLVRNPKNQGFVATVNLGMSLQWESDVVLLNADTQVFAGWLDRLVAHAATHPEAASITPLSNNATICSYPRMPQGQVAPADAEELDRLAAVANRGQAVLAPTGVGFCMWMRRTCMDAIGLFDTGRFGRGYGEENDWCQRAQAAGWQNLIATDVYVVHQGAVSFSSETAVRVRAAMAVLAERYPDYGRQVDDWIAKDPLREARARLDVARLRDVVGHKVVLMISHNRGGGTARHEREETQRLRIRHGLGTLWLRPSRRTGRLALSLPGQPPLPNLEALAPELDGELERLLAAFELAEVQLHHLVDLPTTLRDSLGPWCQKLKVPLVMMVHDYHLICPRITLSDATGLYCGEPDASGCARCLHRDGLDKTVGTIGDWRAASFALMQQAKQVRVPDIDVAQRLARYEPTLKMMLKPHETPPAAPADTSHPPAVQHVLVIGGLNEPKGFDVLRQTAASPEARAAGLRFTLLGHSINDEALRQAGVTVLGRYEEATLNQRIEDQQPDLIWLPSIWPETYSYVLSAAMESGRRVAAFKIGAPGHGLHQRKSVVCCLRWGGAVGASGFAAKEPVLGEIRSYKRGLLGAKSQSKWPQGRVPPLTAECAE
ncbi:MAG: hypothetical protein C4K60_10755 [Ideonella sp. MAG2]|nr:MAG: hypothetical protein C4K60_10755 [Ideonella sp. MAG2]